MLEVTDAVVDAWSADRVAIRISPIGAFNGTEDPEGADAGLFVAGELGRRGLAFLHLSEPDWAGGPELGDDYRRALREAHPGPIVGAGSYDLAKAERLLEAGLIDAAAFVPESSHMRSRLISFSSRLVLLNSLFSLTNPITDTLAFRTCASSFRVIASRFSGVGFDVTTGRSSIVTATVQPACWAAAIDAESRTSAKNFINRISQGFRVHYFANTCEKSANALNSNALPLGSRKNIVACSPTSPANRIFGSITKSVPRDRSRSARSLHSSIGSTIPKCGTGT